MSATDFREHAVGRDSATRRDLEEQRKDQHRCKSCRLYGRLQTGTARKDSLALGNITGTMVFQSTLPVAIGLSFTSWELDSHSILAGCLALAGGLVAILTLQIRRRFSGQAIVLWATFYAIFVAYVVATA